MSYRATVLADAPVCYLRLGERSGTIAADASGNGRVGTYTGGVTLGAGSPFTRDTDPAVSLDGVDDFIDVADDSALDGAGDFSLEIWFKASSLPDVNGRLFYKRSGGNGYGLHITTATGLLTFECETGGVNNQLNTSVTNYLDGQWHHVVATRSGANGSIYVDGALVAGPTALTSANLANTIVLRIGSNDTVTRRFQGVLDEAAVYGSALSAARVAAHSAARLLFDYATFVASQAPEVVVLVEPQPMEVLGSWTLDDAPSGTHYCTFASQIATNLIPGGLYRRLDVVRHNDVELTAQTSVANVRANAASYYLDTSTNRLYVHLTGGVSPNTVALVGAWFTLFFSMTRIDFSDQPLYHPRVAGELPAFMQERPDPLFGLTIADQGSVSLTNGDQLFERLVRMYVWRNKKVTFKLGGAGLAYSDFATVGTMRINTAQVDDELCTLQLETMGASLNRTLPTSTWGDGTFPFSGFLNPLTEPGALGERKAILFGYVTNVPMILADRSTAQFRYIDVDPVITSGPATVWAVYAVHRTTGAMTQLTGGQYIVTGNGFIVQILDTATFPLDTYDFRVDVSEWRSSGTCGKFAKLLLYWCGVRDGDIDATAFAACDGARNEAVGWVQREPVTAADLMRQLEQSVLGQVFVGADGRWTMRLFDPSAPPAWTLADADFVTWQPTDDFASVLNEVRVQYLVDPATGDAVEATSSDDTVKYGSETTDTHILTTVLRDIRFPFTTAPGTWYAALAQHLRWFKGVPPAFVEFEQRGLSLMTAMVGDLVAVTRARGPIARTGRCDGQLFILTRLEKHLGPDAPFVRGVLCDMDGRADQIFRLAPASSALVWSSAAESDKALYGFLADANRYIDTNDPLTKDGKALW
jgi:hypothetical protein